MENSYAHWETVVLSSPLYIERKQLELYFCKGKILCNIHAGVREGESKQKGGFCSTMELQTGDVSQDVELVSFGCHQFQVTAFCFLSSSSQVPLLMHPILNLIHRFCIKF